MKGNDYLSKEASDTVPRYRYDAVKRILAAREKELLELKGRVRRVDAGFTGRIAVLVTSVRNRWMTAGN